MVPKPRAATTTLNDHRSITVCSILDKLYMTCLTGRLGEWGEENNLRADTQTGFRRDHRTEDSIFTLRTLIERHQADDTLLHVAFVDFKKAYDTVPRDKLWAKLQARGISGFMLDALKTQYANVPISVKTLEGLSAPFLSTVGLKQGDPASCDLFGFYIDDMPSAILHLGDSAALPTLNNTTVPPLLHADDLALVATSIEGLQLQLEALSE